MAAYRAAQARWNAGDIDGYLDFYADDVIFGGVSPEPLTKEGVVGFHRGFVAAFPGSQIEEYEMFESGDHVAARFALHLIHAGEFMGVPATGKPADLYITTMLHVRDGRCVERWSTADMLSVLIQIGAVPAPA